MIPTLKACVVFLLTGELPSDSTGAGHSSQMQPPAITERRGASLLAASAQQVPPFRARLWEWWDAEMLDCQHTPEEWAELFPQLLNLAEREVCEGFELSMWSRE